MELSLAVNASLVALSKHGASSNVHYIVTLLTLFIAIFCTEPFRIPFAGRVDVCCFDKTGTITAENLVLEGVAGVECVSRYFSSRTPSHSSCSPDDHRKLVDVKATSRETTLCLAAAHALVKLDDGTVVGDPMEKTTLDALQWNIAKGALHPTSSAPSFRVLTTLYSD
jgi:cation-transporting ATPase 13A1